MDYMVLRHHQAQRDHRPGRLPPVPLAECGLSAGDIRS